MVKAIIAGLTQPENALVIPTLALRSVTSKSGLGVYASSDILYKGAVFGRDSLEVAEDLMRIKPRLARNILMTLASLQGAENRKDNEEEPGKIIHEYRTTLVDKKPINDASRKIFKELSDKWGGTDDELRYYGSIDATPQFLRTLGCYVDLYGKRILQSLVIRYDGMGYTMAEAAQASVDWLFSRLAESRSGLLEFQHQNPHSILNQVWKDSDEFYIHADKQPVNHNAPIASIEVQGLTYDALQTAAKLFPEKAEDYQAAAQKVRDRTIELLWQPEANYFALGTDYGPDGKLRIIQTTTANPAALLDTGFFDGLPQKDKKLYVTGIVEHILSSNFLTRAGIRSRSLEAADLVGHWDYHGSFVSWPKETYDIAKGLRRQGFPKLAAQLESRLLNVFLKSRHYQEFVFVDKNGRVLTKQPVKHSHGNVIEVNSTNKPERIQAWTVSAIMAILSKPLRVDLLPKNRGQRQAWTKQLEAKMLAVMPRVNVYINPFTLGSRYPTYHYRLNRQEKNK